MPLPGDDDVAPASAKLPKQQRDLIATLADNAAIAERVDRSNQNVMEELRDALDAGTNYGPVATCSTEELEKALMAAKGNDAAKAEKIVV